MSGESNTDRGDRRPTGHPQPAGGDDRRLPDTGRSSGQSPAQPAPSDNVAPGWRGGSSWLNPAANSDSGTSNTPGPQPGRPVPARGSGTGQAPAQTPPPGPISQPGPGAVRPQNPGPAPQPGPGPAPHPGSGPRQSGPYPGPGPAMGPQPGPAPVSRPGDYWGPDPHAGPESASYKDSDPHSGTAGSYPNPDPRSGETGPYPGTAAEPGPQDPDFATRQFARPLQDPAAGPGDGPRPRHDDAPTEVFDSEAITQRLSPGPSSWPGHPDNPTAADVLAAGGADTPPPRNRSPRPGGPGGSGGSGGSGGGPLSGARTWLRSPGARRVLLVAAVVFGLALVGYIADLVMTSGKVPRGVEVAGVAIGGMDKEEARGQLQSVLDARSGETVPVQIADVQTQLVPAAAGLGVDWDATWERVGGQPLNPASRLLSFVATRKVTLASSVDEAAFGRTIDELKVHDHPPVEGGIEFQGTRPVAVDPTPGRVLDVAAARTVLTDQWPTASTLDLPVVDAPPAVRRDAIEQALHQIAEPAVSAPVVYTGKGSATATLNPEQIAEIVDFVPDGHGGLRVEFDHKVATDLLAPQLASTEVEPKDATFTFSGAPTVVPAVVGDKVNWAKTLEQLPVMLAANGPQRTAAGIYERIEPKLTTKAAEDLGITDVMGEFTTGGFTGPSGVNIRTVAQEVNGAVVKPGDTFSLNGHTGPRTAAEGYVESGIIDHGRPSKAVGGGISQFATTLYNASYFAGLEDAGHTEHSYYISRYPAAREATVFDGAIDLQFRNNTPHGLYIQAFADSSEVTVRIWGTKTVNVESITGEKSKPTDPETITLPEGDDCIASHGAPGFTISDTRVITDLNTGQEVSRHTRTVKYDPVPEVKCENPDEKKDEDKPEEDTPAPTTTRPSTPGSDNEGRRPSNR